MKRSWLGFSLAMLLAGVLTLAGGLKSGAGTVPTTFNWQAHAPIVHGNLALFPVTAGASLDAGDYLTLDEGLRSGEVEVTELGAGLIRRRPGVPAPAGSQVNTLVLVNHSQHALILLAGEIVTGGKQDRVISQDRIVPPGAEPLPLDVFCVEPGRWHGASLAFKGQSLMAAPTVREKATVAKNQQEVWSATGTMRNRVADAVGGAAPAELQSSSSYAEMERSEELKRRLDTASDGLQRDYERSLREALRGRRVVGVVVAINGQPVWADLFGDPDLFQRYWPKLLRSYVVEALGAPDTGRRASLAEAQRFLEEQSGKQIIEVEPGEYRLTQIEGPRYSIFALASLWEKSEPLVHFNKLRKETSIAPKYRAVPED